VPTNGQFAQFVPPQFVVFTQNKFLAAQ